MKTALLLVAFLSSLLAHGAVIMGPMFNPANGHFYSLMSSNTWAGAEAEAVSMGGNLATIDDAAENDWVFDTFSAGQRNLWIGLRDPMTNGVYLWVDGSPLGYSNWDTALGQPNGGNEQWVFIAAGPLGHGLTARKWHDVVTDADAFPWLGPIFGIVEQTTAPFCSPHRAAARAVVQNGNIVGTVLTDLGCGYTNPPLVLIQEGGGSNATATAVITNGFVIGVNITDAGCCYSTNPGPKISIASPPFVPTLGISVSRVNVTQHVVLGRNYLLESSSNLVDWVATGPPFTAQSEDLTNEFVVGQSGPFFRIKEVP